VDDSGDVAPAVEGAPRAAGIADAGAPEAASPQPPSRSPRPHPAEPRHGPRTLKERTPAAGRLYHPRMDLSALLVSDYMTPNPIVVEPRSRLMRP